MSEFELQAQTRPDSGTRAARRLRRTGRIPAVIYGGGREVLRLSLDQNELKRQMQSEAFFSHILTLRVDGGSEQAVVKALQREPGTWKIRHLDFQRVVETEELQMNVPLHFVNEETSVGEKAGGVFSHLITDVEIRCLPRHLPEYLEVDVAQLDIGDSLHLSDIKLPEGVELVALSHGEESEDEMIVSCYRPQELDLGEEEELAEEEAEGVPTVGEAAEEGEEAEAPAQEGGEQEDKD